MNNVLRCAREGRGSVEASERRPRDVEVERLRPAPRDEHGAVAPGRSDLIDRSEW
jgi:hypothetical protein